MIGGNGDGFGHVTDKIGAKAAYYQMSRPSVSHPLSMAVDLNLLTELLFLFPAGRA
jgi:hypothetical protein